MESIIRNKGQPQPYVLATGNINCHNQLLLIVDCQIVCEIQLTVCTLT